MKEGEAAHRGKTRVELAGRRARGTAGEEGGGSAQVFSGGDAMARESKVLQVGDRAPDFRLPEAASGREVELAELLGQPLLLYFGRGTW